MGILTILGTLFGFKSGATIANTVTGVANWGTLVGGGIWAFNHSAQQVQLGSVSVGGLAIGGIVLFAVIEAARRVAPGAGGQ